MSTIAESLGIKWGADDDVPNEYRLSFHAQRQAQQKGWSSKEVLLAANSPLHTYRNGRFEGQFRHVRNGLVAVVNPATSLVVTVYADTKETELRADQTDGDALAWEAGNKKR
jgi:hypothetical protein